MGEQGDPDDVGVPSADVVVRIRDLAGRPRGLGFLADHHGTLITAHEVIDGLPRIVLYGAGERTCVVTADAVTPLPELDLALVRTDGLGTDPLPVTVRERVAPGTYLQVAAGGWREARVLCSTQATYTATDRFHLLDDTLELAIGTAGRDALRLGGGAAGGPVLDASTGTVVAVLGTALQSTHRATGFAIPLRPAAPRSAPLTTLLTHNAATVPAYGPDLNLAGTLELTATSVGSDGPQGALAGYVGGWPGEGALGGDSAEGTGVETNGAAADAGGAGTGAGWGAGVGEGGGAGGGWSAGVEGDGVAGATWGSGAEGGGAAGTTWGGAEGGAARAARGVDGAGAAGAGWDGDVGGGGAAGSVWGAGVGGGGAAEGVWDGDVGGGGAAGSVRGAGVGGGRAAEGVWGGDVGGGGAAGSVWGAGVGGGGAAEGVWGGGVGGGGAAGSVRGAGVGGGRAAEGVWGGGVDGGGAAGTVWGIGVGGGAGRWFGRSGGDGVVPVERVVPVREFAAFSAGTASVLALVGPPGSGRTTELAALAARRHRAVEPAPTLWLRGADLRDDDESLADAAGRALRRAARIVTTSQAPTAPPDPETVTPAALSRIALTSGRPLFLLLDGPEEMPPVLAHRLADWTEGTVRWLRETGARLVVACRAEYWQGAGTHFPREMLHALSDAAHPIARPALEDEAGSKGRQPLEDGTGRGGGGEENLLPACVELGELTPEEAALARDRYGVPEFALAPGTARHPLTLRLLSEIRAALPDTPPPLGADREDIFGAYLDLMCLRIAVRLAMENGLRGTAVRRLAAKVSGQVHEAARRTLGPGQGELDTAAFEEIFPWGQATPRLGGGTGWASAVLAEGLLVPAGTGYRFAHEDLADWLQGLHLDLDEALKSLTHRPRTPHLIPVPHHRIGPVIQSLLLVARHHGPTELSTHLRKLTDALAEDPHAWWPAHLLTETLLRVPDATPYLDVLHALADHVVARTAVQPPEGPPPTTFLPAFWTALPLPPAPLFTLLRHLLRADPPPGTTPTPRYLDAVAALLAADAGTVQPHLTLWFEDDRPLPGAPEATVAAAAQALLYAYRHHALDDLTEVLVGCGHRRADELLGALAEDEPSALCRAVDRWARDTRPARRVAAVSYGLRAAPYAGTDADRDLLKYAAQELLTEAPLEGGALGLLVQDPRIRTAHLPRALAHFTAADPGLPPTALLPALRTHPEPVLKAFRTRLNRPDTDPTATLRALAEITTHPLTRRIAIMVRETVERRPEVAEPVAGYVDDRLRQGTPARAVLHPLVTALLTTAPEPVRSALAGVLATPDDSPLRAELREFLLAHEQDPAVLTSFLHAAARHRSRDLVHRAGRLLVRTPDGATRFDRGLVDLGRHVPGFAARVADWIGEAPEEWATVVGPGARRMIENLAGAGVPV